MPGLYEYTLTLNDRASGTLQKLAGSSYETVQKFVQLSEKTDSLKRLAGDTGKSLTVLKQKIDLLQGEKELIDSSNITQIRTYNKEIAALNKQITKLETDTGGSKFGKNLKDAFSQIPGAGLFMNPVVMAGAGIAAVSKLSMSWEDGMAKINTTAQLPKEELDALSSKIKKLGVNAGADLAKVPDAYEKIISQTGNVALSTDILAISLQGAKAGYADVDLVAGAVGQSLSAIGKGKESATEVMDVLFAAKRVGAGEFADFAANIPQLINAGQGVGVTFREVAGAFAYMTGKGNSASSSTMLLQNAFSQLGRVDFQDALKTDGIEIFKDGKMRGLSDIMTDFGAKMAGMNDDEKTAWLDKIGLKDMQAKQAFMALSGETNKLKEAMDATANATGETAAALDKVNTPGNKIKEIWSNITGTGLGLGAVINSVLNPILDVLLGTFKGIFWIVGSVGAAWSWWTGKIQEGSPVIWGLTALITGLGAAIAISTVIAKADAIATALWRGEKSLLAIVTGKVTAAQWGLNAALLANPITWVVICVGALVAAFIAAWKHSEKFRGTMTGVFEVLKGVGSMLITFVIAPIKNLITGLGSIGSMFGKLFKKDFAGAAEEGKNALMAFSGANTANKLAEQGHSLGFKFKKGYAEGTADFRMDKEKDGYIKDEKTGKWSKKKEEKTLFENVNTNESRNADLKNTFSAIGGDENGNILKKIKGKGQKSNNTDKELSLGLPQNYNQTGSYSAIAQKFGSPLDIALQGTSKGTAPGDSKEKPVINMATRVDEIAGSLKRMAAAVSIPVALTLATSGSAQNIPTMPDFVANPIEQTQVEENNLLSSNSYDNSQLTTNEINSKTETNNIKNSSVANNNQDRNLNIVIDKIEIRVQPTDNNISQQIAANIGGEVEKALAEILNV